jgi:hypothetical protein
MKLQAADATVHGVMLRTVDLGVNKRILKYSLSLVYVTFKVRHTETGTYTLTAQQAGNSQGMVEVLNVSTGIYARGGSSKLGGEVLALACDASGQLLWAGNNKVNSV